MAAKLSVTLYAYMETDITFQVVIQCTQVSHFSVYIYIYTYILYTEVHIIASCGYLKCRLDETFKMATKMATVPYKFIQLK